jgi:hypothetical protein
MIAAGVIAAAIGAGGLAAGAGPAAAAPAALLVFCGTVSYHNIETNQSYNSSSVKPLLMRMLTCCCYSAAHSLMCNNRND